MPDRHGQKASLDDLLPEGRQAWAREIWKDRDEVAQLPSGGWLFREAAKVLGLDEEAVDKVLSRGGR